jgi:hypothetical protein
VSGVSEKEDAAAQIHEDQGLQEVVAEMGALLQRQIKKEAIVIKKKDLRDITSELHAVWINTFDKNERVNSERLGDVLAALEERLQRVEERLDDMDRRNAFARRTRR